MFALTSCQWKLPSAFFPPALIVPVGLHYFPSPWSKESALLADSRPLWCWSTVRSQTWCFRKSSQSLAFASPPGLAGIDSAAWCFWWICGWTCSCFAACSRLSIACSPSLFSPSSVKSLLSFCPTFCCLALQSPYSWVRFSANTLRPTLAHLNPFDRPLFWWGFHCLSFHWVMKTAFAISRLTQLGLFELATRALSFLVANLIHALLIHLWT